MGRDTVSDVTGIAVTTINKIRTGERHGIRKNNERKILSVTVEAISDGHFVDAKPTWRKIRWLLSEGFTYAKLSERLGYKSPTAAYNIGKIKVKASTERKIEKFYNTIRAGETEELYEDDLNNFLSE